MEEQGLAQQSAQVGQQGMMQKQQMAGGAGDQQKMMQIVQQVAELIMRGVSVDELRQQGVPDEIIQMAMQLIEQHDGDMDDQTPQVNNSMQGQGLAQLSQQ